MNIRTFRTLTSGVYRVVIHTEDWSELDKQLMQKYGEPTIDLGGTFITEVPYDDFELANNLVRIMSESPFTQRFDSRDDANGLTAVEKIEGWIARITNDIKEAVVTLRANQDTFTREEVEAI